MSKINILSNIKDICHHLIPPTCRYIQIINVINNKIYFFLSKSLNQILGNIIMYTETVTEKVETLGISTHGFQFVCRLHSSLFKYLQSEDNALFRYYIYVILSKWHFQYNDRVYRWDEHDSFKAVISLYFLTNKSWFYFCPLNGRFSKMINSLLSYFS